MINGMIFLASYGVGGGSIGNVLSKWEQLGFFEYLLPFLLIFAVLNGILNQTKLFQDNKSINAIISLVVGLIALQSNFVSAFFAEIFPRLGVGLAIILVLIIVMGLFLPDQAWITYTTFGVGVIILAIILIQTAGALGWAGGDWWYTNWEQIAWIVGFVVLIIIVANAGKPPSGAKNPLTNLLSAAINPKS